MQDSSVWRLRPTVLQTAVNRTEIRSMMKVTILSVLVLCTIIHHCNCLPRKAVDEKIEAKVAKIYDDEHPVGKDRRTHGHIPIPTNTRTANVRTGDSDCNPTPDGKRYTGHTSVTRNGVQCQAWASQTPHKHEYNQDYLFPDASVRDASNYCRNPVGLDDLDDWGEGLWCYTTDPGTLWDRCDVPLCGTDACSGTPVDYTANSGTIQSPGYATSYYPDNARCQWRITAPTGKVISVTFHELSLEAHSICAYDRVTLYDGSSVSSSQLGKYCSVAPATITSSGSSLFIVFTSDSSVHNGRFSLSWSYVSQATTTPPATTTTTTTGSRDCGIAAVEPDVSKRIVGGDSVRPHSWPWMCWIGNCGGTVIDEYHVMTAAHCIVNTKTNIQKPDEWITVTCGLHNRRDPSEKKRSRQVFTGVRATVYPGYRYYEGYYYDIAIIRLPRPLVFNEYVQPVCLPSSPVAVGTNCVATGWGYSNNTGDRNVLRQVNLPIVDWTDCYKYYYEVYRDWVKEYQLCAGPMEYSKSVCFGDSGGPLVCKQGGRWYQYGIASFLYDDNCHVPYPNGFAAVVYYRSWIQQQIANGTNSRTKSKSLSEPSRGEKEPVYKDGLKPPVYAVWDKDDPPLPPPVGKDGLKPPAPVPAASVWKEPGGKDESKPPLAVSGVKKKRVGSKPSADQYKVEKELLDLLQRKFADD